MARIRTFKPEFHKDFKLWKLDRDSGLPCRMAYQMLWSVADRRGRFEWSLEDLKIEVMPHDSFDDFHKVMDKLVETKRIILYEGGGKQLAYLPKFEAHQSINNREGESTLPPPPGYVSPTREGREDDASSTCEPRENYAIGTPQLRVENGLATRETTPANTDETTREPRVTAPEDHACSGERKGKEGKGKEGKTRERVQPSGPDLHWWGEVDDPLLAWIGEQLCSVPKYANASRPATLERTQRLLDRLRAAAPSEDVIRDFVTEWVEFHRADTKGRYGKGDPIASITDRIATKEPRWQEIKRRGNGKPPPGKLGPPPASRDLSDDELEELTK